MNLLTIFAIVLFSFAAARPAFNFLHGDDIKKKRTQLDKLRGEIEKYESRIKESEKKERVTLDMLSSYDRQGVLLRKLIAKLHDRELTLQKDIEETKRTIRELSGQLSLLKQHYAAYVSTVYKYGRTYDLELLLSSKSFNQLLIRSEYLKRFSNQRKIDLDKIDTKRNSIEEENKILMNQLNEQKTLIAEKRKEETRLNSRTKKRKAILTEIRKNTKNYKRELDRRKQDVKELEQIITKLIEEDRASKDKKDARISSEVPAGTGFVARRGRLPWPVANGKVTSRFGTQQHPTLRTVTQNTGIDISVPTGTNVHAVAAGEVSKIHWLPSYGNLIIIHHTDGYRTVYAHMSEISVNEGEKVNEGDQLGKSGESINGSVLHFEIYKDREKQDPEKWLRQRGLSQR
ncbi:MAG: peptidoglycan DD-metalloendopeptidase family protein [Ignavibacteriales bacterium]|nr:peptidoglycan DD-metalloendopeptidase family protein [Ignavibacteriales bacterium]